jgi:hypothetical protein
LIGLPAGNREAFVAVAEAAVGDFASNPLFALIDAGKLTKAVYHRWLRTIFHQTYQAAATFALAGGQCDARLQPVRDYLIEHAEEERTHWRWVLEDLRGTGYEGPDPRSAFPSFETQNYISLNFYLATRMPVARLGTAAVLEGIGATYAKHYSNKVCEQLGIKAEQVTFAYGHGDTDVGHTQDIYRVLSESDLSPYEWAWCTHAARTAGQLYRTMYASIVV